MTFNNVLIGIMTQLGLLETLSRVLQEHPLLTVAGWSLAVFGSGFATRRYFQDRELDRAKHDLLDIREKLEATERTLLSVEESKKEHENRMDQIADCIDPSDIKRQLASVLSQWPDDHHDLIVVGVVRQLIVTPGRAWVCTPSGSTFVKVDWDEERGSCRVYSETSSSVDPIKELREFISDSAALATVLFHLAAYGITTFAKRTSPTELKVIKVRQGTNLQWRIEKQALQRVP